MLIDSPSVIYGTFQRCRHVKPDCGELLVLLNSILEAVSQQGSLLVEVPDQHIPAEWVKAVHEDTQRAIAYKQDKNQQVHDSLSPENQSLFALIRIGTRELQRLWAAESKMAVQSLGYVLHVIPPFLRTPEQFNPQSYMFCLRILTAHWHDLSIGMRKACCRVVGLELDAAQLLINTSGLAIDGKITN